jgi:phosphonate transport system substrate-binding protein
MRRFSLPLGGPLLSGIALSGLVLAALALTACGDRSRSDAGPTLTFSAIPGEEDTKLTEKFNRFGQYLSKTLGVPVEYRPSAKYGASVRMFEKGEIQLAWFGGLTGVQARSKVEGSEAIAQGAEDPNYYSYFIASAKAGITPSEDQGTFPSGLEGKSFTFGSPRSTSGRLMPEFFIRSMAGKSPKELFGSEPQFSQKHNLTAKWVESGKVQVGALSYKTYDKMVEAGELDPKKCVVIWKTPYYADYNFTVHPKVNEMFGDGFVAKLKAAILAYDDKDVLKNGFQRSKLIGATNADFDKIKDLAAQLGFLDVQ